MGAELCWRHWQNGRTPDLAFHVGDGHFIDIDATDPDRVGVELSTVGRRHFAVVGNW